MFLPHPRVKVSIVGSLRDREVACSASDRQGSNFESCVWRTVSFQSSHHPQEVLLAQFSVYVHKGGLKPDSFHFFCQHSKQTQDVEPMLVQCWYTVCDAHPASNQHWFNASCLLGLHSIARWSGIAPIKRLCNLLDSAYCRRRVQADTDPMSVKC